VKKVIFIFILIYSVSLFATDVSNFDIKGIKLGMSKDEVLKKMPNSAKFIVDDYIAENPNYPYKYQIFYKTNTQYFGVEFDYKLNAYKIERNMQISNNASMHKVVEQITNHYGQPDYTWKINEHDYKEWKLCWGNCHRGKYHFLPKDNSKILYVTIWKKTNLTGLSIELEDAKLLKETYQYKEHMFKKAKEELVEKDSKIDL